MNARPLVAVAVFGLVIVVDAPETALYPPMSAASPAIQVDTMAKLDPVTGEVARNTRVTGNTCRTRARRSEGTLAVFIDDPFFVDSRH